jgi:hypothetical protein
MFPLRIFAFQPRITIAAAMSLVALTMTAFFLYQAHVQPTTAFALGEVMSVSSGTTNLSAHGGAQTAAGSAATVSPLPEMHIANNGLVLLRGAHVISVSGGTIQVGMSWNSVQFTWVAQTNSSTLFFTAAGERETSPDIQIGDTVTVTGTLVAAGSQPTIDAEYIDVVRSL